MWAPDRFPAWVTIPVLVFVVVIAVTRLALVRRSSALNRMINATVGFYTATSLLPTIAPHMAAFVPGGSATLFAVWHWCSVMAWGCGLGFVLLHEYGPVHYRIRFQVVVGLSTVLTVVLQLVSSPAQAQGVPIADYGGWRYGVYVGLYAAMTVVISFSVLRMGFRMWPRTTTLRDRILVAILCVFAAIYALPTAWFVFLAALRAVGAGNDFTRHAYSLATDGLDTREPGLVLTAIVTLVFVPSSARAVAQLLRLDHQSRIAHRLNPLWRDLTAAAPQVVFPLKPADRRHISPKERAHRRRVEIHDAAQIIARFVAPLPVAVDDLIETTVPENDQEHMRLVAELVMATQRLARPKDNETAGEPTPHEADVPDEQTLLRYWEPAKVLLLVANKTSQASAS
ncbi:DUF6545 domain-containing protein [Nocardia brasiliensis]|uniref:DUF6545 domain-containing protein n=1 Tax=Nocardia brasiliensis TaxID=37326 RepID=UPI0036701A78